MAHADGVINVTQSKFEQFVGKNRRRIGESEERVVREDSPQSHSTGM
jgi:hypothetical protein